MLFFKFKKIRKPHVLYIYYATIKLNEQMLSNINEKTIKNENNFKIILLSKIKTKIIYILCSRLIFSFDYNL